MFKDKKQTPNERNNELFQEGTLFFIMFAILELILKNFVMFANLEKY